MSKVPEGWIKAPVEYFGDICAGRQRAPNFINGTLRPYLRVANVFDGFIKTSDVNQMYFTDKEFERFRLEVGDILLNEGQSTELVGRPAMYLGEPERCCFQNTLVRFKHNNLSDPFYALQRFRMCLYDGTFQVISKKTTSIAHLGVSRFANLELLWPPLPEQTKIAKILSTWDKAIATTEQLIGNSQQQKKALMQSLLTGKKRLPGFEGEWKKHQLEKMGKIVSGGTPDTNNPQFWDGDILWMTPTDVTALKTKYIKNTLRKITKIGVQESSAKAIPAGSLLVCTRATIGLMSISSTEITTNQGFKNLVPNEKFNVEFLYFLFSFYKKYFIRYACGSTFLELSKKDFEKLEFSCPLYTEQQKIAAVLTAADNEIELLQKKLAFLKQEKTALMQQLLTGKRRVKVEAA